MLSEKIDIVIPWVDHNDENWQKEKKKYEKNDSKDSRDIRYRDWGLLRYFFRGIEENMPWINKVHFVTWGHIPSWLNLKYEKLNVVKHEDFIPKEYLPTYSSHTIELNMHRITGLSDKFIYFNDDIYVIDKVNKNTFFSNGLPSDSAILRPNISAFRFSTSAIEANNLEIINTNYNFSKVLRQHRSKWFNIKYKRYLINSILLLPYRKFTGFLNLHLPNPFLKETFQELWDEEYDILNKTCLNRFRDGRDVNQWLFRYKQLVEGKFTPKHPVYGHAYSITNENSDIYNGIRKKTHKIICLNDNDVEIVENFEDVKKILQEHFNLILSKKSKFEK